MTSLESLKSRDVCTPNDFEHIVKSLRYQLVAMAMGTRCPLSTPRIEVQVRPRCVIKSNTDIYYFFFFLVFELEGSFYVTGLLYIHVVGQTQA